MALGCQTAHPALSALHLTPSTICYQEMFVHTFKLKQKLGSCCPRTLASGSVHQLTCSLGLATIFSQSCPQSSCLSYCFCDPLCFPFQIPSFLHGRVYTTLPCHICVMGNSPYPVLPHKLKPKRASQGPGRTKELITFLPDFARKDQRKDTRFLLKKEPYTDKMGSAGKITYYLT